MTAKLRRYGLSIICSLLCWALVLTPCLFAVRDSFSYDGDMSASLYSSAPSLVPSASPSVPLKLFEDGEAEDEDAGAASDNIQNIAASDKVLSGLGSGASSNSAPSKPAAVVVKPPVQAPATPSTPAVKPPVTGNSGATFETLTMPNGNGFTYYEQTWDAYKNHPYGYNTVGSHGCGPTSMAMVITNLTGTVVTPSAMADWSYQNGFYVRGRGTAYGLFPAASAIYGIKCSTVSAYDKQAVVSALQSGKLLLTVVGYGDFTVGRHFLLIRGITADGKLLLADSGKYENCLVEWDYSRVLSQVVNGSFWVFEK